MLQTTTFFFFFKPFPLPEDGNKTLITFGCYLSFLPLLPPLSLPLSKPALRFQLFTDWERHTSRRGSKSDCRNPDSLEFIGSISGWSRARPLGSAAPAVWMLGSPPGARRGTLRHRAGGRGKAKQQHLAASHRSPPTGREKKVYLADFFFVKHEAAGVFDSLTGFCQFLLKIQFVKISPHRACRLFNFIWNSLTFSICFPTAAFCFLVPTYSSLSLCSPFSLPITSQPYLFQQFFSTFSLSVNLLQAQAKAAALASCLPTLYWITSGPVSIWMKVFSLL